MWLHLAPGAQGADHGLHDRVRHRNIEGLLGGAFGFWNVQNPELEIAMLDPDGLKCGETRARQECEQMKFTAQWFVEYIQLKSRTRQILTLYPGIAERTYQLGRFWMKMSDQFSLQINMTEFFSSTERSVFHPMPRVRFFFLAHICNGCRCQPRLRAYR